MTFAIKQCNYWTLNIRYCVRCDYVTAVMLHVLTHAGLLAISVLWQPSKFCIHYCVSSKFFNHNSTDNYIQ